MDSGMKSLFFLVFNRRATPNPLKICKDFTQKGIFFPKNSILFLEFLKKTYFFHPHNSEYKPIIILPLRRPKSIVWRVKLIFSKLILFDYKKYKICISDTESDALDGCWRMTIVIPKKENTNTLIILYSCLAPSFVKMLNTTPIYASVVEAEKVTIWYQSRL